tara:strand:- start:392 stop:1072 length:681 start_codon:yes stop_codon:yes gene_type:complete
MKNIYLALLFITLPVKSFAQSINTSSQSTGSVVNQAVQVVPARQFQYQLGANQVCQGTTLNISPFLSATNSFGAPYQPYYSRPIYSTKDIEGAFDADNNPIGDGEPDEPTKIIRTEQVRTGMQESNTSLNGGITMTFSIPLDRAAVRLCRRGMERQIEMYEASLASKRLNYEMSRLATCGKHIREGTIFVGEMAKICADVRVVTPPNVEHTHPISSETSDSSYVQK